MNKRLFATGVLLALSSLTACSGEDASPGDTPSPEKPDPSTADDDSDDDSTDESGSTEESNGADAAAPAKDSGTPLPSGGNRVDAATSGGSKSDASTTPGSKSDSGPASGGDTGTPGSGEPAESCAANEEKNPAGADPCKAPLRPGEDRLCQFSYNGAMRKFYIYAPPSYNACQPAAMVLDMHGATESAEVHIGKARFAPENPLGYGSSWRRAIQGDNAIVVTPEGTGLRWNKSQDPAYLNKVADMVEAIAKVDPAKRYLTGISMGGMITAQTGCLDAKRWRGMVPIAMLSNTCPMLAQPTPAIIFHAMTDSVTSYPDSRKLAMQMVMHNKCTGSPTTKYFGGPMTSPDPVCFAMPYGPGSPDAKEPYAVPYAACPSDRPASKCEIWSECADGAEVHFCTVEAAKQRLGGHLLYTNDTALSLPAVAWPVLKKSWK